MYKIGDLIIYGTSGVCKVEDIGLSKIPGISEDKTYYTLKPLYQDGTIFTPVDTTVFMRPIISYEETQKLIELIPFIKEEKFDNNNMKALEDYYRSFLRTNDSLGLFTLVKILDEKKDDAIINKKKLSQTDEKFMTIAQSLIDEEFATVLGIGIEEVPQYIKDKIDNII